VHMNDDDRDKLRKLVVRNISDKPENSGS
jgi:hypothetical protein